MLTPDVTSSITSELLTLLPGACPATPSPPPKNGVHGELFLKS